MAYLLSGVKTYGFSWNSILWSYPFKPGRSNVSLAKKYRQLMVTRATLLAISHLKLTRIQSLQQPDVFFSVSERVKPRILPVDNPHLRAWFSTLSQACFDNNLLTEDHFIIQLKCLVFVLNTVGLYCSYIVLQSFNIRGYCLCVHSR